MDINIKIIEGVRQFPSLYNNNDNLDERNQAWMQLAEQLEMHEQFLKIRWHSILQAYQRDANFKYANRMHFVCRRTERNNKENWPEFIITEEYLKDDNPEEQEQFVFLDTDEEERNSKECKSFIKNDCHFKEISKQIEFENNEQTIPDAGKEIEVADVSSKPYETKSDDVKVVSSDEEKDCYIPRVATSIVEEKMAAVDVNKNDETSIKNSSKEPFYEKSQPLIVERCEDVIFGELVSAMLKRMDENKKKNIKREIMNLLFS